MDDAARNFKDNFEYLKNFSRDQKDFIEKFRRTAQNPRISTGLNRLEFFKTSISKIQRNSEKVLVSFDKLNFANQDLFSHMEHLISVVASLKTLLTIPELQEVNLIAINSQLFVILMLFTTIDELIDLNFKFDYTWNGDDESLTKYDSRGRIISSDPGYIGSPIETLENFVLDRVNYIKEYIGSDFLLNNDDDFSKVFFAIVAPSMTGKTQAAFAFTRVRCLYFLLCESFAPNSLQDIYKNFSGLSKTLKKLITEDFKKFKKLNALNRESDDFFEQISSTLLWEKHGQTKFKTLGFIYALIEHSNENFDPTGDQSWMRFFATSNRSFIVESKSLEEFRRLNIGSYALFFDEFATSKKNAFVRNLFRTALAPVFVANTNSNAANLIGKITAATSRTGDIYSWSLAAIELNNINQNILRRMYPQFDSKKNDIIQFAANDSERNLINSFFDNFITVQLEHFRPGFVDIFAGKICEFTDLTGFTLNGLLQAFAEVLYSKAVLKKPAIKTKLKGILGSLALFMKNAYLSSDISNDDLDAIISHMKSYIQYHYYYLINPVDVNKWCFLTYRPEVDSSDLRVYKQGRALVDWEVEYTYFKKEEIIPSFVFQSIVTSTSIPSALKRGLTILDASPYSTGRSSNTSQNVPLSGDELEVLSSTCLIEASQHEFGAEISSFEGQNGATFLTNLVENLIEAQNYRRTRKIELDCSIIGDYLKCVHVPFLFPAGMNFPEFFETNFSNTEGFLNRSVNFGEYKRTENRTEIDGIFNYFIKNGPVATPSIGICSTECKNWNENLSARALIPILIKAKVTNSAKVCLLFCNSLGVPTDETLETFVDFCVEKKYLVLKVKELEKRKKFELAPYCPGLPSFNDSIELVCIIFELFVIDPDRPKPKRTKPKSKPKPKPKPQKRSKPASVSKPSKSAKTSKPATTHYY